MNKSGEHNRTGLEIAVIGMNGRFPGAIDIDRFWYNLKNGVESITFFSAEELEAAGVSSDLLHQPDYVKAKGTLEGIEYFDSLFFGYTSREAELMDPQFRIFHECCWAALESAGYNPDLYSGVIGLYAGCAFSPGWLERMLTGLSGFAEEFGAETLNDRDYLSTRIAYKLNLNGPGFTVQTACSTSLLAIHLACQGLLSGECGMALAGGVSVTFLEKSGYHYQEGMILSADGHCRAFAAEASGTVFGDGAGAVVLKTLEDAVRDGDSIAAIIKGSAINNDGSRKVNYTSPSPKGQAAVIRAALQAAEVPPESISYIETHGTGTALGDPIEIEALKIAFDTDRRNFCGIGSVKTNVGHLNIAAGITGFIKTILALKHRLIPPSLHFKSPNAKIDFENSPFYVVNQLTPWENDRYPLRAGVSSFGIGGTNAHVVVEEWGEAPSSAGRREHGAGRSYQLILLSARTQFALDKTVENLSRYLEKNPNLNLADAAYTLQVGRKSFPHRKMTVCAAVKEAIEILSDPSSPEGQTFFVKEESPAVVFMFPGQGSQYVNMGLGIYREEPVFRDELDRCFDILKPLMGYDIKEILYPDEMQNRSYRSNKSYIPDINQTEVTQPIIFAFEYALAKLLMAWGITPYAMIGHSIGEYVAACLSGVFSLEDVLKVVAVRGKLMQKMPGGAMLSVELSEKELLPFLPVEISLAAVNTTERCVVSGPQSAIAAFDEQLKEKGIQTRLLHTSHAFHSGMMAPILKPFEEEIRKGMRPVKPGKPGIPYVSNLTGRWITVEEALDPGYWVKHLRSTVRFSDGLEELLKRPAVVFVEVGPGKTLSSFVRKHNKKKVEHMVINLFRHPREDVPDRSYLLRGIGRLWLYGVKVDWIEFHGAGGRKKYRVPLPTYPFEGLRYWRETPGVRDRGTLVEEAPLVKKSDIGRWFYTPCWKRSSAPIFNEEYKSEFSWLFFMDDYGIGDRLKERFEKGGQDIVTVRVGAEFSRLADGGYIINPCRGEDYLILFDSLKQEGKFPGHLVHLWNVTGEKDYREEVKVEEAQQFLDLSFYSLLYLAQALGKQDSDEEVRLTILTNQVHEVNGDEDLCPLKAAVLGPAMVIPQEYFHIKCTVVDIVLPGSGTREEEKLIRHLTAELINESPENMIAYRNNYRLVQTFEPFRLESRKGGAARLRESGVYLITGGLGGIGLVMAQHLSATVGAKLILTGRSSFPEREEWQQWLDAHSQSDTTSRKIRKIKEFEDNGSEVLVRCAEVNDYRRMYEVMREALERFGTIHGVIHSAGVPGDGLIQLKTREMAKEVLAPKVKGTLVLDRLLKDFSCSLDFFLLCSSVNSVLPVLGQVDYFAANAFLDAFAYHKSSREGVFTISVNWDTWQEVGMAVKAARQWTGIGIREVTHPLLEKYRVEEAGQAIFQTHFNLNRHWVISEHMTPDKKGLVPGTAYLEMAWAAFENLGGPHNFQNAQNTQKKDKNRKETRNQAVEITDVRFLHPLMVEEGEEKEAALVLRPQPEGGFDFLVASRAHPAAHSLQQVQVHAQGKITTVPVEELHRQRYEISEIQAFCNMDIDDMTVNGSQSSPQLLVFGPRWKSLKWVRLGKNQALGCLELNNSHIEDFNSYKLHPALLDVSTGFFNKFVVGNRAYIPFSYKRLIVRKDLSQKVFSYSRLKENHGNGKELLKFDVTIMDESGMVLADIEEFTMLHVSEEIRDRMQQTISGGIEAGGLETGINIFDMRPSRVDVTDVLRNGILPSEGIDIFNRILGGTLPQVVISTTDLSVRFEQNRKISPEDLDEGLLETSPADVRVHHERPDISTPYVPPENKSQEVLAAIWQELLGICQVGIHDDFFELGGDSLKALSVGGRIRKELKADVPLAEFFNRPTIKQLAQYIAGKTHDDNFYSIKPVEEKEYYPLSSSQKRLYILHQMDPESVAYNLPDAFLLEGQVDEMQLEMYFLELIKRHESFRTSFGMIKGQPVQKVQEAVEFEIESYNSTTEDTEEKGKTQESKFIIQNSFIRPFDLSLAPLLRVGLVKLDESKYLMIVDVHHIIHDGTSQAILFKEFSALNAGEALPELSIQYKDYSGWQNRILETGAIKQQGNYWVKEFKGEISVMNLPFDFSRPAVQSYEGGVVKFTVGAGEAQGLRLLALKEEVTLYMVLFSVYYILLSRLSGQEDIVVGTPTAGRKHMDLFSIIGMFLNILALRNYPTGNKFFSTFLKEVKQKILWAFEKEDYPFERLVDELEVKRDLSRNPLFDVMFIFHNELKPRSISGDSTAGLKLSYYDFEKRTAQYDLTLVGFEGEDELYFEVEYCSELFRRESILCFVSYFRRIVSAVLADPDRELSEIEILSKKERSRLLDMFNDTRCEYPTDKTIHQLFEEQVTISPGHTAVIDGKQLRITYNELNRKSDQLAHELREKGVRSGSIVGVMVGRSVEMFVALLGILKSGAAYLPIDPMFPEERVKYVLAHSNAALLLTSGELLDMGRGTACCALANQSATCSPQSAPAASLAYIIYTSGSTGSPKGVMVTHRSAVNFIAGMTDMIDFSPGKRILALTTISFDIFFLETLLPLTLGLNVVVADESRQADPKLLEDMIVKHEVDMMQVTPSRLKLFLDFREDLVGLGGVKELMVGGEAFPVNLFTRVKKKFSGKIFNMYGPTETTIWSSVKDLSDTQPEELTIGSPIANTQVYIVDKHMRIQPLGAAGELLIGGDGVAAGYLNNVELTAEKFVFSSYRSYRSYRTYSFYFSKKLYKTGDLARWLPHGEIEFLGRLDHQVKIRGFRIELEEIEEQLLNHENIEVAVVTAGTNPTGDKYLAAYIVCTDTAAPGRIPTNTELREYLSGRLPLYMVPTYFVHLESIPLTFNGKADRKALPEPDVFHSHPGSTYVAPETSNEKVIANLWREVLQVENVGIHDNFFDLGGNSLNVIQMNRKLKEKFGKDIPVAVMFRNLTIDFLVQHLGEDGGNDRHEGELMGNEALDKAKAIYMNTIRKFKGE